MTTVLNTPGKPAPPFLSRIKQKGIAPPRIIVNAVEGWGKTTLGAYAPNPAILMCRGETGYVTLERAGRVPDADCVVLESWQDVLAVTESIVKSCSNGSIIIDAMGGFERLCHEFVCARDFGGDWGEKGFTAFQRGYDISISEWLQLLVKLDRINTTHNIPVVILSHSKIRPFKNPMGSDFDRYVADCHDKTWGVTHKWADAVLFGNFATVVIDDKKTKRPKGRGTDERTLYTVRCDAFDAKNRYGMANPITMPADPAEMWGTMIREIGTNEKASQAPDLD